MRPVSEIPAVEKVSDALRRLLQEAAGRPMQIREMIEILHGRGLQMIIVLLCLPFLAPVTIPGISTPFGLAIALCGVRIAFGHKPWLPAMILNRRISYQALEKMVQVGCRIYGKMEQVLRPRLLFLVAGPGMVTLAGSAICLSGLALSLPIPPPFILTNTIPAFAIVFLALGLMERDGVLVLIGHVLTLIALIYVGLIAVLGRELLRYLFGWW
jgi:hypothetical protein